jgi:hypothetical protein
MKTRLKIQTPSHLFQRQPGCFDILRPVAFRPRLTTGLASDFQPQDIVVIKLKHTIISSLGNVKGGDEKNSKQILPNIRHNAF